MRKNEIISFMILSFIFAAALVCLILINIISTAQAIDLTLTFFLVCVTLVYAVRTAEIAGATRKQAEEVKAQRYSECLPILVPDISRRSIVPEKLEPNEIDYQMLQTGVGLAIMWRNLGKGVAINTRFSFWSAPLKKHPGKTLFFPPQDSEALEVMGAKQIKVGRTWAGQWCDLSGTPRLEAEYQDIYERKITTVQEFRVDKKNRKAFLGELYFTINGRRLGTEVINHD